MIDPATPAPHGDPRVLLIVGGGIAAYKTPALVRAMVKLGAQVQVVSTRAAGAFVTPMSLATVSGRPVRSELLDPEQEGRVGHIELADWPDLVVVAPGTANLMARAATGIADDLATTVLLATRAPILWAPAMNTNMWTHPATQHNVRLLQGRGHALVGPAEGDLACGWQGVGAMVDVPELATHVSQRLETLADADAASRGRDAGRELVGRRVVVSAGPTRTYLDPVRFVTNASSGVMGFELAAAAAARGAHVHLVAGPVQLPTPPGVHRVDVQTADEMYAELTAAVEMGPVALLAMVAAVSDLRVDDAPAHKPPKDELASSMASLGWRRERDLLASLVQRFGARVPTLGFAAQTVEDGADEVERLLALGRAKMEAKGVDAIFVNRVGVPGQGFEHPMNGGHLLWRSGDDTARVKMAALQPKPQLARWIMEQLILGGVIGSRS